MQQVRHRSTIGKRLERSSCRGIVVGARASRSSLLNEEVLHVA
ncbi:hypothetical protein [uncultured Salinicola sp.]|nr:hypothetical protein [uncultured Salinicola sp.]